MSGAALDWLRERLQSRGPAARRCARPIAAEERVALIEDGHRMAERERPPRDADETMELYNAMAITLGERHADLAAACRATAMLLTALAEAVRRRSEVADTPHRTGDWP